MSAPSVRRKLGYLSSQMSTSCADPSLLFSPSSCLFTAVGALPSELSEKVSVDCRGFDGSEEGRKTRSVGDEGSSGCERG